MSQKLKNGQSKTDRKAGSLHAQPRGRTIPKSSGPPVFQLIKGSKPEDSLFSAMARLARMESASIIESRSSNRRSRKSKGADARSKRTPWPLEVLKVGEKGMLALRVQPGAGLQRYGLFDGDILLIGVQEEIEIGSPAFAVLDDDILAGWFKPRRGGQVAIVPFVSGAAPVIADRENFQVLFELKAIACSFPAPLNEPPGTVYR